jgi:hypothetical protein
MNTKLSDLQYRGIDVPDTVLCNIKSLKIPKGQSEAVNRKKDRQYNNQMKIDKQ